MAAVIPHAVICAGAVFLLLAGDQISARRRKQNGAQR